MHSKVLGGTIAYQVIENNSQKAKPTHLNFYQKKFSDVVSLLVSQLYQIQNLNN